MKFKNLIMILLLIIPISFAEKDHMILLAVSETEEGLIGNTADLYLDIKAGDGSVFLETFPLSKLDTQMSTRFAKQIVCNEVDINCNNYDFFYTIEADSPIIGGPSAGAAIAVLTIAKLENLDLKEDMTITGTINPGGFIGPVGGLKEKIDVAKKNGIKKVLIPKGERILEDKTDLVKYGENISIEVIEVFELNDAISIFTGKQKKEIKGEIKIDEDYKEVMKSLAENLCNRSLRYQKVITDELEEAINLTEKGMENFDKEKYYSAASFCYGANIQYSKYFLKNKNLTIEEILDKIEYYKKNINKTEKKIDEKEIRTITDLEAYSIVKERLINAKDYLILSENYLLLDPEESVNNLAFAIERTYSALLWSKFFDKGKKEFILDKETLKEICTEKIAEAQERHQYVQIYFPELLKDTEKEINRALEDYNNEDYELCLFKASKAKAEADNILTIYGVDEEQLNNILKQKLEIVKKNILKRTYFPIVGYSYYEYASVLDDVYISLLYSEYALELSNLDMYFKKDVDLKEEIRLRVEANLVITLIVGIVIGVVFSFIFFKKSKKKKKRSKKNKPKRSLKTSQGKKR